MGLTYIASSQSLSAPPKLKTKQTKHVSLRKKIWRNALYIKYILVKIHMILCQMLHLKFQNCGHPTFSSLTFASTIILFSKSFQLLSVFGHSESVSKKYCPILLSIFLQSPKIHFPKSSRHRQ